VLGVKLSKPDKELWPPTQESKPFSKLDLARYLEVVGPWMLEHIGGRPCSILRAPDGINGERFFQRHAMPGLSKLITETPVGRHVKPYLQIDRLEALIALAQVATVEFHPWNSAPGRPERPGRLIFDLDPGSDVAFALVIAAAKELRERLEPRGHAAHPQGQWPKLAGGQALCRSRLRRDGARSARALSRQYAQGAPPRPHLSRLSAQ
jgi:bifunctional non-homologous end joining protein LigD